jgi:hypothetical protein
MLMILITIFFQPGPRPNFITIVTKLQSSTSSHQDEYLLITAVQTDTQTPRVC